MSKFICSNCGYTNKDDDMSEVKETMGCLGASIWTVIKVIIFWIGFIALLFIPIIGWILAIILLFIPISSKKKIQCPHCKMENCIIPIDSPKGKELLEKYYKE